MSYWNISIRWPGYGPDRPFCEATFTDGTCTVTSSLLDLKQRKELARELREAADEMDPPEDSK